eukprot:gene1270-24116_t
MAMNAVYALMAMQFKQWRWVSCPIDRQEVGRRARRCVAGHLSSKTAADRARNYHLLIDGCALRLCPGRRLLDHFDNVVVCGDLNYRIADKGK